MVPVISTIQAHVTEQSTQGGEARGGKTRRHGQEIQTAAAGPFAAAIAGPCTSSGPGRRPAGMGLLHLATGIQEQSPALPVTVRWPAISEQALRPIAQIEDGEGRKSRFRDLISKQTSPDSHRPGPARLAPHGGRVSNVARRFTIAFPAAVSCVIMRCSHSVLA